MLHVLITVLMRRVDSSFRELWCEMVAHFEARRAPPVRTGVQHRHLSISDRPVMSFARRLQGAVSECATGFCNSIGVASGAATVSLTGLPEHATAAPLQASDSGRHPIRTYS